MVATTITLQLPHLHEAQRAIFEDRHRFKAVRAGRRFGKTKLGSLMCLAVAAQNGRAWWVAPQYGIALIGWRMMRRLSAQIPGVTVRESERMIVLPTGGSVQIKSADNPDSLRGEGLDFVVLDECAFLKEETWVEVLRPTLADRQGGALFISTPKGKNWFHRIYYQSNYDNAWQVFHYTSYDNPYIKPSELDALKLQMSEQAYRQEILAEFIEGGGDVFRNVTACLMAPLDATPEQHTGHHIVMGCDWARESDFSCFSVGCVTCRQEVARDRFNQVDYHVQVGRLQALAERWKPAAILSELNSIGVPVLEMLQRQGLPVVGFTTTAQTKPPLIENMALAFERGEWQWQADPVWTAELEAYERTVSPTTGRSSYSAPAGSHDDTVMARSLMLWQAQRHMTSYVDFV